MASTLIEFVDNLLAADAKASVLLPAAKAPATPPAFDVDPLSAEVARSSYPALWATAQAALPNLLSDQIAVVVSLVVGTCQHCYEAADGCRCWDDS